MSRLDGVLLAVAAAAALFSAASFAFGATSAHPPLWTALFAVAGFTLIAAMRFVARAAVLSLNRRGVIGNTMVVLGTGDRARRFLDRFHRADPLLSRIAGVFALDGKPSEGALLGHPVRGGLDELIRLARQHKIDDVVVAMPWSSNAHLAEVIEALKELPVNVHLSTEIEAFDLTLDPCPGAVADCPLFAVARRPIAGPSSFLKAAQDYVLATLALLALAPLLTLIAIAIKIDSPGPVFFMQKRLGFNNRPFEIFKFRSMHHNRSDDDQRFVQQATRNDPRVTRVGRLIRATSLDELPQLLNVLNGTMSLVGPRPHALSHNEEYGHVIRGYFARHRVKPGITGWAQVKGLRGETGELSLMEARVRHDLYYADHWSVMLDIKILVMTVLVVLFQRTAY
jgi:Undecaprenyl-phosphate glucose phosphotransferase